MSSAGVGTGARSTDRASLRGLSPTERDAKGRVRHEALTDEATQLPNRLHFDVVYRLMWEAGGRGIPVALLRFDLPGFGGGSPDSQRRVGDQLGLVTRQMDMIGRLDEDRFAVLLMGTNAFGGRIAAERFQVETAEELAEMGVPFFAGVTAWADWMTHPDDLMTAADQAVGVARSGGGEAIEMHRR